MIQDRQDKVEPQRAKWFVITIFLLIQPAILSAKAYKGGELRTRESYVYGRFEVRMKSAAGSGLLSSFFTFHDNNPDPINNWNEIDIEILGRYTNDIQFNTITPGRVNHVFHHTSDFNPHDGFHVYAIEWTPAFVKWFVDSVEVYRQTGVYISQLYRQQKIMMNIWPPDYPDWAGEWDDSVLPVYAYYDWVKCYSYQPGSGNYGSDNFFLHEWTDDFDQWDQARWQKATHTFEGNNSDFIHENVVFLSGYMILCLTTASNTGYHGEPLDINDESMNHHTPGSFLYPNYPNPFNRFTTIMYEVGQNSLVRLDVYNILGQKVQSLVNDVRPSGRYAIRWPDTNRTLEEIPSGTYLLTFVADGEVSSRKVMLMK